MRDASHRAEHGLCPRVNPVLRAQRVVWFARPAVDNCRLRSRRLQCRLASSPVVIYRSLRASCHSWEARR